MTIGSSIPRIAVWATEAGHPGAPVVVLVHGSMARSGAMRSLSAQLATRYRVVRYDRRGYGRSIPGDGSNVGPFSVADHALDLIGLIADRPAVVIGHSFGGHVALAAAEQRPDLVVGVGLYETPLLWAPWWPATTASAEALATDTPTAAVDAFMSRMIGHTQWGAMSTEARRSRYADGPAMVGELTDLARGRPWEPRRITCPIVISRAEPCAELHRQSVDALMSELAQATFASVPGCGHDAPATHPQLFAATVVDRLCSIVGPPWSAGSR